MYTTNNLVNDVWKYLGKIMNEPEQSLEVEALAQRTVDHFQFYERDNETGEMIIPKWIMNLAKKAVEYAFRINQRVILTEDYTNQVRYKEGEVILPSGSVGWIYSNEGDWYQVNFGTVMLAVYPEQMRPF